MGQLILWSGCSSYKLRQFNEVMSRIMSSGRSYAMQLDRKTVLIFAYSSTRKQSNKRSGTRLKTENEAGERR